MAKGKTPTTRVGGVPIPKDPESEARASGSSEYPAGYDIPSLRERRYLWTARLLAFVAMLSMILNITLGWALASLAPLKEVRPFLVQLTEGKDVYATIRPIGEDPDLPRSGLPFLTKQLVGEYIRYRHEIVRSDEIMKLRWIRPGYISLMSSEEEYGRFINAIQATFNELRKKDATIEVDIKAINPVTATQNGVYAFNAEFETHMVSPVARLDERTTWIATIEVEYKTVVKVPLNLVHLNPTGFTVRSYTYQEKR